MAQPIGDHVIRWAGVGPSGEPVPPAERRGTLAGSGASPHAWALCRTRGCTNAAAWAGPQARRTTAHTAHPVTVTEQTTRHEHGRVMLACRWSEPGGASSILMASCTPVSSSLTRLGWLHTHAYALCRPLPSAAAASRRCRRDRPVPIPTPGVQLTSISHVEDIASMMAAVPGNRAAIGQHYNCCSDRTITFTGEQRARPVGGSACAATACAWV